MKSVDMLLAKASVSIKDAWRQLNESSHKILFITDVDGMLIGSLTDGDIRRWILSDKSIHEAVSKVMNASPLVAFENDNEDAIKKMMLDHRVECIPIIDVNRRVRRFVHWNTLLGKQEQPVVCTPIDVPVVIMAGGRGVRLDPFTKILPKPLIPLGDKPILEIIVEKFRLYDVKEFFFSVNYRANMIKAYFDDIPRDYALHYIEEAFPQGTAGSLHMLKGRIHSTFMISNCDIIVEANYADILRFHRDNKNKITLVCSMRHFPIPYGVVDIEAGGKLKEIREKPEFDFFVNTGFYVLEPELLDLIPNDTVFHITHLIERLRLENAEIGVYPISSTSWMDVGELKEYKETAMKFQ